MVTCDVASQSNSAARGSGRSADPHTLHHYPDHPQLWVGHDQVGLGGRLLHDRSDDPEEPLRVYGSKRGSKPHTPCPKRCGTSLPTTSGS